MKTTALMYYLLSGAAVVLGAPQSIPGTSHNRLKPRQGEGNPDRCPGGQDFNFCVPFLNATCPPVQGPGGFPIADGSCTAANTQICSCWCSCNASMCDAANLPVPDYC